MLIHTVIYTRTFAYICAHAHTVNDKSKLREEKFCGSLDFIQIWGKLSQSLLQLYGMCFKKPLFD